MNKKMITRVSSLILIVSLVMYPCVMSAAENSDSLYSITMDSEDWEDYSVQEKIDMLRISEEKLDTMTNEELIYAVAEYPYIGDIYLTGDNLREGIESVSKYSSALEELLEREIPQDNYKKIVATIKDDFYKTMMEDIGDVIYGDLAEQPSMYAYTYVTTPNGTSVSVQTKTESHTAAWHEQYAQEYLRGFAVSMLYRGSCLYNCHSYAWYSQSTSNPVWMSYPTAYMTDGSYRKVYSGGISTTAGTAGVRVGDIIYYGSNSHSAVVTSIGSSSTSLANIICKSKWGTEALVSHKLGTVPGSYDTSTISIWRR